MKENRVFDKVMRAVTSFVLFFLLSAFLISCCLMLFLKTVQATMGLTFTAEDISDAAKVTMANVILLSLLFAAIDTVRRHFAVERPVREIVAATERMVAGDFSVRISPAGRYLADDAFHEMILAVNQMAEELSGVETLRTDFIANVSHEMKTPLAVIQNYGTLLQAPDLPEEKRLEYAAALIAATRRLGDMMTNILRLNRLENQKIYPALTEYDLGEQLCECLLQYEEVFERKEIEPITRIEEGVFIRGDRELLALVWNNLFSNAFKFTEEGGRVTVSLHRTQEGAVVRVADTGCGMSAEVGAHIFEKFYQGDSSHAGEGNGLGLALVKRVVDICKGEITVESTLGEGTAFTVTL